ncbi:MAG TPA: HDIG domain-containing protein [Candidatus Phocaeicola gallistercoris]|nr:HDIG domain-containing protein [Candidatus Phocaeicola gallistercoris]
MNPLTLIDKYYPEENELKHILLIHSHSVTEKALTMARNHPELNLDLQFIEEAAMLHDIGIFQTDAKAIYCFGSYPYICHGYLGSELIMAEGFPRHALVCERHTGAGLSLEDIEQQQLPIPHRDMRPISLEEQIICFADKFFSKTKLDTEKTIEKARKNVARYGEEGAKQFDKWCKLFL